MGWSCGLDVTVALRVCAVSAQGEFDVRTVYVPPADTTPAGKENYFEVGGFSVPSIHMGRVVALLRHDCVCTSSVRAVVTGGCGMASTMLGSCPPVQVRVVGKEGGRALCLCANSLQQMQDVVTAVNDKVTPAVLSCPVPVAPC